MKPLDFPFFPHIISQHAPANIPLEGISSHLVQAGEQQFIFMSCDRDVEVDAHTHNAQWGVVLDGEMELTINGEPRTLRKGDSYFIEKDVPHSARIKAGYKDLTLFNEANRYQPAT